MASNGGEERLISAKNEANCLETTVEIKIKTLDSQTYTLRVDKYVPVHALKEQIASVTGVLSEQQRLICRGKVLKDDQLLSAYNVEDGHTLHLVVKQQVAPSSDSSPNQATDPASTSEHSQGSRSANISELDETFSDLSHVFSAVLDSLGIAGVGSGSEGVDLSEHPLERISGASGNAGIRNSSRQQSDQADSRVQSVAIFGPFSLPTAELVESLQPPVIPDSLATLSQNLNRLRQEFTANVEEQSNSSQAAGICGMDEQNSDVTSVSNIQRGLRTPASLADVMLTTRQILNEQVAECLLLLARQLEGHANVTDASERVRIQSNALRLGVLFQNLGAVILELARTIMTLQMAQTPVDAIVNAGPAVFLSPAGPNPIMVQPPSFQMGTRFGATAATVQQSSGLSAGSGGSVAVPSTTNWRESTGSQNLGQTAAGASNNGNSAQQGATGIICPVVRVRRVMSRISGSTRGALASDQPRARALDQGSLSIPDTAAVQHQNIQVIGVDGSSSLLGELVGGQEYPAELASRFEQSLRGMFPGDHLSDNSGNSQSREADSVIRHVDNSEAATSAAANASDEGTFLSHILREIMPMISENAGSGYRNLSSDAHNVEDWRNRQGSTETQENADPASSSHRQDDDPLLRQLPKRRRMEE